MIRKFSIVFSFMAIQLNAQVDSNCFSIEPNQTINIPENAQVGDTISTIQYCSSGEWKKIVHLIDLFSNHKLRYMKNRLEEVKMRNSPQIRQ